MPELVMKVLVWIVPLVVAIVCHEVAHGWVANAFGDHTARDAGRLTLNPLKHVDPVGTVVLPMVLALSGAPIFGWAKPVPVVESRMRNPRFNMMAVAAAGPATNVVLAILSAMALLVFAPAAGGFAQAVLVSSIWVNAFLAVFNMLPLPPFDGSRVVAGLLPGRLRTQFGALDRYGFAVFFALLFLVPMLFKGFDPIARIVVPPTRWLMANAVALAGMLTGQ